VIDTTNDTVIYSIDVRPGDKAPIGSAPNALAVSADAKTLYVANGANKAIAVVDIGKPGKVRGLIPTGWYPTAVASAGNGKLWVASGYGFGSIAPQAQNRKGRSYRDRLGVVSLIDLPEGRKLRDATAQVMANNRLVASGETVAANHPVPIDRGHPSPIRHVFYIIKENRTYDQVLGDLPQGNGDPSLVQFGRDVSPNHHALAESFVLLDNFYTPADQSALGHKWCTQGYASDWAFKYSNGRNDGNPMLSAPNDALWDNAKAHGVSVRAYGERGTFTLTPPGATFALLIASTGDPLVIPALNRDGDILSDLVLPLFGSIAGSESLLVAFEEDYEPKALMAEAAHGTAPSLHGKNVANPMAMILAGAALLAYGDERSQQVGRAVREACLEAVSQGVRTADLGGHSGTTEYTDEVIRRVKSKLEVWATL